MTEIKTLLLGKPRDVRDPRLFHKISLIAFLAWVGLGADGLSSSAYGPDEAYRAILQHPELAVLLALATAGTVFVISFAYSRLIEHFPHGGGGYVVATKLLGPYFGVLSGCALLVDYVLTITTSIASAADQTFSFLPLHWQAFKLPVEGILIVLLVLMNLRGVKESVAVIAPIFVFFLITHVMVLAGCLAISWHRVPAIASQTIHALHADLRQIGLWGVFLLFMNAYSRGAGTYTGIEAVSNGVPIMREPKVATAKKTMAYMAASLAITAGGILLGYLLVDVKVEAGKTLNAVLMERLGFGTGFVVLTLLAEGGLLVVASQTGFIDGPRVMANMALDGWLPRRFSSLSEQFTIHQGVLLMGIASLASLIYTRGNITALVTMYSINVFVTFSLSQLGMCRFWWRKRADGLRWKRPMGLHLSALFLCVGILFTVVIEKFAQGAWMTLVVTSILIAFCLLVHEHYRSVQQRVRRLSEALADLPLQPKLGAAAEIDPSKPTAVLLVANYSGLGIHSLLAIQKQFSGHFRQVLFASVAVIDSGAFKGEDGIAQLEEVAQQNLRQYLEVANGLGFIADCRMSLGTDPVAESEKLCVEIAKQYSRAVIFAGKLVFQKDTYWQRLLHNETALAIQRRLHWLGIPMVVLPIRVR